MNADIFARYEIERLLRNNKRGLQIPSSLRSAYILDQEISFTRLVELWSPLLILAFVVCLTFAVTANWAHLVGRDLIIYVIAEALIITSGILGLYAVQSVAWRGRARRKIPHIIGFILLVKIGSACLFHSHQLAQLQVYMTLVVMIIGALGLQQPVELSLRAMIIGFTAFPLIGWATQSTGFLLSFIGMYIITGAVCLFVSYIKEGNDKLIFLQTKLLDIERQEVQRLASELAAQVSHDALTGLFNRRHLDDMLASEWDRARRDNYPISVLMIDVDYFKQFNDQYGHPAGDNCLKEIARVINMVVQRPADLVARYGGEEFLVLLPGTNEAGATELANTVIRFIDDTAIPHRASTVATWVTVSVGVATCSAFEIVCREDLIEAADQALYEAKRRGRHTYCVNRRLSSFSLASQIRVPAC